MAQDLTKGNTFKNLIKFAIPFFFSYFMQTLYGLADLFFVGKYNGAEVTTAVSIGSQVMHMITVIIVGLAMGATVVISQAMGAKRREDVSEAIGTTFITFTILSLGLCLILLGSVGLILSVMSTPQEAFYETKRYLCICFIGIPFITAYNVISSVFRGLGDSKSPMFFVMIACVINIVLDYIFIGCFNMHAMGAALGTVFAQTVSVIVAVLKIWKGNVGIHLERRHLYLHKQMMIRILKIGLPVSIQDGFIQIAFLVITVIANTRGVEIAAAVGIVEKIIGIMFLVPSSMLSAVSAIVAQNVGAGEHVRARETLKYGIGVTVVAGIFFSVISQFGAEAIVGMFTTEPEVISFGGQYLRSYVVDCIFAGMHFCFSGYFCAYGKSMISFIHNVASIILVRIPGAYFASVWFPKTLFPMGMAAPLGSLLSTLICIGFYIYMKQKLTKKLK